MKRILLTAFVSIGFCSISPAQQPQDKISKKHKTENQVSKKSTKELNGKKEMTDEQIYQADLKASRKYTKPNNKNLN